MTYQELEQSETVQTNPAAYKAFKRATAGYRYGVGQTHQAWVFFLLGWNSRNEVLMRNRMGVGT